VTSPEERIELVRRGFAAYNARDVDAIFRLLHPEIEIYASDELINAGTFHGHEGYVTWVSRWEEAWDDFTNEPVEITVVGDRHAAARVRASGRGRGSGIEVGQELGYLYDVRDGVCVYLGLFPSFEEARRVGEEREGAT
jgi:ketosteroid isomerase-like protein